MTVKTLEAANKAVAELDKKEVDGRNVIVEVARTNENKRERAPGTQSHTKRKQNRRGSKAVQGEVTEAEADGTTTAVARIDEATTEGEGAAPKESRPKKKKAPVSTLF